MATVRRARDLVTFLLACLLVGATAAIARGGDRGRFEVNLFRLVNELPGAAGAPLLGVMQLGALMAVPCVALVAVLGRRVRLARAVLVAGGLSWASASLLERLVAEEPPEVLLPGVLLHRAVTPGLAFPATHVAVAAGMATAAGPYLGRSGRRLAWAGVVMIALARVYVGAHLPVDALGGIGVGVACGSLWRLVAGVPRLSIRTDDAAALLATTGRAISLRGPIGRRPDGGTCFVGAGATDGPVVLVVASAHQAEGDWLRRLWRGLAFRELDERVPITRPEHRVDHEAHALLRAAGSGVTPVLVDTAVFPDGTALLVRSWLPGRSLTDGGFSPVGCAALPALWRAVAAVHERGVSRLLGNPAGIVVECGRFGFTDLGGALVGSHQSDEARDLAGLCVLAAEHVPPSVVGSSLVETLGVDRANRALQMLEPLSLPVAVRRRAARRPGLLRDLRAEVADAVGTAAPKVDPAVRVAFRNIAPFVALAVAVNVLLPALARAATTTSSLPRPVWPWVAASVLAATFSYLMAAVALIGASGRPLAVGRTWAVQLAAACANRVTPAGLGGMATNLRYLEAAGLPRPSAVTALGLNSGAGLVVHLVAIVVVLPLAGVNGPTLSVASPDASDQLPGLLAFAAVVVVLGALVWGRWLRGRLRRHLDASRLFLRSVLLRPRAMAQLMAGSLGVTGCYALALFGTCRAFGVSLGVVTILAIYLGASAIAAVAPTPGGLGAIEAALVAGLTPAGVTASVAVAAVLTYRLITYWAPVLPGLVATRALRRSGVL